MLNEGIRIFPDRQVVAMTGVKPRKNQVNLAKDPKYKKELAKHRQILAEWIKETGDQGQQTESDAGLLATLKRWGDKCVNPEYNRVRPKLEK